MGGHAETWCKGLDDLEKRCSEAYAKGARFAKWRNVLQIDPANGLPSDLAIAECVHSLSRYAAVYQRQGLVPIVEPEIVPNGEHDISVCAVCITCVAQSLPGRSGAQAKHGKERYQGTESSGRGGGHLDDPGTQAHRPPSHARNFLPLRRDCKRRGQRGGSDHQPLHDEQALQEFTVERVVLIRQGLAEDMHRDLAGQGRECGKGTESNSESC